MTPMVQGGWRLRVKRAADVAAAAAGLVALAPVMGGVALGVAATLGRPVVFRQKRAGKDGKVFVIRKFRSMTDARGPDGAPLPDAARLTRFGRFLRASSLDELPQLVNVLRGEMSLVGPRPLPPAYLPRYSARHARRHEVLPGITGYSAINGRNAVGWDRKLDQDVWYVENWSLRLDAKILLQTVAKVVRRDGISAGDHATMPEFLGSGTVAASAPQGARTVG